MSNALSPHFSGRQDIAYDLDRKEEEDAKHDAERDRFDAWFLRQKTTIVHVYPSIPCRAYDWQATFDDYDDGPVGRGATSEAALADLKQTAWDREMDVIVLAEVAQ